MASIQATVAGDQQLALVVPAILMFQCAMCC
jgi:hypothetical protein